MKTTELTPEVLCAQSADAVVDLRIVEALKARARKNKRGRSRILLHPSPNAPLHEMIIVLPRNSFNPPIKNAGSSKSFTLLEGELSCVIFTDEGEFERKHVLRAPPSEIGFMLRLNEPVFHSIVPLTDVVVFIETILGPFQGNTFAPWAPQDDTGAEGRKWRDKLLKLGQSSDPADIS